RFARHIRTRNGDGNILPRRGTAVKTPTRAVRADQGEAVAGATPCDSSVSVRQCRAHFTGFAQERSVGAGGGERLRPSPPRLADKMSILTHCHLIRYVHDWSCPPSPPRAPRGVGSPCSHPFLCKAPLHPGDRHMGFIDAHVHVWTPDTALDPLAEGYKKENK